LSEIQTELENRAASRLARQLCVHDFIRPVSEATWPIQSQQYVRTATPPPAAQVSLDDRSHTGPHRVQRSLEPRRIVKAGFVSQNLAPELLQMIQISFFMSQSPLGKNINGRIVPVWPLDLPARGEVVQRCEIPACQVFAEVARRKLE
jgi:hypothetical protein